MIDEEMTKPQVKELCTILFGGNLPQMIAKYEEAIADKIQRNDLKTIDILKADLKAAREVLKEETQRKERGDFR